MSPTRVARNVSTVAVASIAAWSSWSHMVHVALRFGERPEVAYVLPISVDGMLIVASTAMVDDQRAGRPVRWSARVAFIAGVGASVAANIAAAQPTLGARIVAAWPAIALLLVVEMLSRVRRTSTPHAEAVGLPAGADPLDVAADAVAHANAGTPPEPAGTSPAVRTRKTSGASEHRRRTGRNASEAALKVREERPDASTADIAAHLGVTERHVRRLLRTDRKSPRTTST
ncbi:DUF2637 domain-containing protein [Phytohabitans rumicis]|uniref:DUF2637 domain-containing protein n=1 Tax=Phytohabitans rumicis TaxID=1076125 RepID=A0A6V8L2E3_9ACTN|nr:DUF2637 domain-containing protein [Phytohabitans rumicis]GFJ90314.1 hypothetical protein Prum_039560 [Phytohabitans rumicis]